MASPPRGRISREQVVEAALELLAGGLQACSVRAVAARLGVTPMAIYWHVTDKDALFEAVLDRVLDDITPVAAPAGDPTSPDPLSTVSGLARGYRAAFGRHPQAAVLLASRPAPRGERAEALLSSVVALLRQAGLPEPDVACATMLLLEFVMGSVLLEHGLRPGTELPLDLPDPDSRFEFGLACLLDGLRARVR